jgi:hypothetical protein
MRKANVGSRNVSAMPIANGTKKSANAMSIARFRFRTARGNATSHARDAETLPPSPRARA